MSILVLRSSETSFSSSLSCFDFTIALDSIDIFYLYSNKVFLRFQRYLFILSVMIIAPSYSAFCLSKTFSLILQFSNVFTDCSYLDLNIQTIQHSSILFLFYASNLLLMFQSYYRSFIFQPYRDNLNSLDLSL